MNSPRSFRATELAKEFARQGHEVTVLTPKKNEHIIFEKKHNVLIQDLGRPRWREIKLKGKGISLLFKRGLRRILQLTILYPSLEYFFLVKKALRKNQEHYDLLISIAVPYPIHWGVAAIWSKKSKLAKQWAADCGDPFIGEENDSFKLPFYFKYVEKWFCKKAGHIIVPVKSAIPAYPKEYHYKIKIIPQGFKFEEVKQAPYQKNKIPHFAYAGSLIPGRREPKEFFDFLINYPHSYKFDIYTNQPNMVSSYAYRSNGRIEVKEFIPRTDLLFQLSKLDFVVNFENAGTKQVPSKIIDYTILQKPILSVNSHIFTPRHVEEFLMGNYQNKLIVENPEQYKIENVVKKFLLLVS